MSIHVSCRYAMLVCSLPPLPGNPFAVKQTPLSRLQLDRRLALLEPGDAEDLETIDQVIHWERIPFETTDPTVVRRASDAMARLGKPTLREILAWRLELRTLVAALRRRHRGLPVPAGNEVWGYGQCLDDIRRYWDRSDFNLGHRYPWIETVDRLLRDDRPTDLEHFLVATVWDHYTGWAENHHFDFEAVVLYVLRWNLIDRLTRYGPTAARQRFDDLLNQGLGTHARRFGPLPTSARAIPVPR